jgi:hypothetical protein
VAPPEPAAGPVTVEVPADSPAEPRDPAQSATSAESAESPVVPKPDALETTPGSDKGAEPKVPDAHLVDDMAAIRSRIPADGAAPVSIEPVVTSETARDESAPRE